MNFHLFPISLLIGIIILLILLVRKKIDHSAFTRAGIGIAIVCAVLFVSPDDVRNFITDFKINIKDNKLSMDTKSEPEKTEDIGTGNLQLFTWKWELGKIGKIERGQELIFNAVIKSGCTPLGVHLPKSGSPSLYFSTLAEKTGLVSPIFSNHEATIFRVFLFNNGETVNLASDKEIKLVAHCINA